MSTSAKSTSHILVLGKELAVEPDKKRECTKMRVCVCMYESPLCPAHPTPKSSLLALYHSPPLAVTRTLPLAPLL